jgi:phage terminase large subunit-like protein
MIKYALDYNPIREYWEAIREGKEIVSAKIKKTYRKLVYDLDNPNASEFFYDPKRANRVLEFAENFCKHSKGKFGGKPVRLELWEKALLCAIFGFVDIEGNRKYREAILIVGRKNGKSLLASIVGLYMLMADGEPGPEVYSCAPLALDTVVPTVNGLKTMGTLSVGDYVYTPSGKPTRVNYITEEVMYPTYELTFDDGTRVRATGNHPWRIEKYVSGGKNKPLKWVTDTVETEKIRIRYDNRRSARIRVADAYEGASINLPIEPYTLGSWLGDGRNNGGQIAGHKDDVEIPKRIMADKYQISYMKTYGNTDHYTVLGLRTLLRENNLLNNKHIPEEYFQASIAQRQELLKGLMDTDGTCTKTGECRYVGNCEQLCNDVHRLVLSLGLKGHIRQSKDCNGKVIWVVSFKTIKDFSCFNLTRKHNRLLDKFDERYCKYRYIESIERIETIPCKCIEVEDESHLFVIGKELITTHNTKREQAKIIWMESKRMIAKSPALAKRTRSLVGEIAADFCDGTYKPLASDSNTLDGLNVHCSLLDEIHAWQSGKPLYDVIVDGCSAREQPLIFITTTSGTIREDIYDMKYDEAKRVIEGYFDPMGYKDERLIAFVYELDKREEWMDESCWKKANPGLGTIKNYTTLKDKVEKAKANPLLVKNLVCKEFNIPETTGEAWLTAEQVVNEERFDVMELKPRYGIGGVDLSSTTDLTAAKVIFRVPNDEKVYVLQMYWIPEDNVEKRVKEDHIPYDVWIEQGLMRTCKGNQISYHDVTAWFLEVQEQLDVYLYKVGYDSWSAKYWVEEMEQTFGTGIMEQVIQGKKTLSGPMKSLGADLDAKKVIYNNNPIDKWCLFNTAVDIDRNDNIQPMKTSVPTRRIDGTAALLDAYVIYQQFFNDYMSMI